jgi:hypothetical protein
LPPTEAAGDSDVATGVELQRRARVGSERGGGGGAGGGVTEGGERRRVAPWCCWAPTGVGSPSHVVTRLNGLVDVLDRYWARPSGWASVYIVQSHS